MISTRQRAAIGLFLASALILFVMLAATVSLTWRESQHISMQARDNLLRGVMQLETDLQNLTTSLFLYGQSLSGISSDDVRLRLDVVWSRIDVFSQGEAVSTLSNINGVQDTLQFIANDLSQAEGIILGFDGGSRPQAITLAAELLELTPLAHSIGLDIFHHLNNRTVKGRTGLQDSLRSSIMYLIGIFFCSVVIGLLWLRETRRANASGRARDEALMEAQLADKAKSEFLASMSHELRTPLNAVIGFSQLLGMDPKEPLSDKQKEYVDCIAVGGGHLNNLVGQVLDLSNIEAGKMKISVDDFAVAEAVEACLDMIGSMARKENIKLINRLSGKNLPTLQSDRTRVNQVLMNFLSNAVKYNKTGGTVVVDAEERPGQLLRIIVEDTGPGIAKDMIRRLFVPFDRLGREAQSIEGTGIGLTISKKVMDALGGDLGVETTPGRGCKFWMDVPLVMESSLLGGPQGA